MLNGSDAITLGVEEEYQIIHPKTRRLVCNGREVLTEAKPTLGQTVRPELQLSQIEVALPVCSSLAEVRAQLVQTRHKVIEAAKTTGNWIAAAGTHPFSHWENQKISPQERYQDLEETYQQLTREQLVFGCHVHVGLEDDELAIDIMNRARVWLSPLLALAASSPFWLGKDTGYASFRTQIWSRWPISGPPHRFTHRQEYDQLVQSLIDVGLIEDASKIYWDIRLPTHINTIEFRVFDVPMTIDETVMLTGLIKALVHTCYQENQAEKSTLPVRQELLQAAHWQAARYGLDATLIDVINQEEVTASTLIESMLEFLRPSLETHGDWAEVSRQIEQVLVEGNGAQRQRKVYQHRQSLDEVLEFIVQETQSGLE